MADTGFGALETHNERKHPAKSLWADIADSENMGRLGVWLRHRKNCDDEKKTAKTCRRCHMLRDRYHLHVFAGAVKSGCCGSMFFMPSRSINISLLHNLQEKPAI